MATHRAINTRRSGGLQPDEPPPPHPHHVKRWPAVVALLALGAFYLALPDVLRVAPRWLLLAVVAVTVVGVIAIYFLGFEVKPHTIRVTALSLLGLATAFIAISVAFLVRELIRGKIPATDLLGSAAGLWGANVVIFTLWYWEIDRGGPHLRHHPDHPAPDFLFPQQTFPVAEASPWCPTFADYLYVAFTTATAFSPTDTMPLSHRAKMLMMVESLGSLLIVAVLAGRAINIIGG